MEAPESAYLHDSSGRPVRLAEETDGGTAHAMAAAFISVYGESSLQTSVRVALHLDRLLLVSLDDGRTGFVGAVLEGGVNEGMRDMSLRDSGMRIQEDGKTYKVLNDAGLNVRGRGEILHAGPGSSVNPSSWVVFENMHDVTYEADAPFWTDCDVRLYVKTMPSDPYVIVSEERIPARGFIRGGVWSGELPESIVSGGYRKLYLRLEAETADGTSVSEAGPVDIYPDAETVSAYLLDSRTQEWNAGTSVELLVCSVDMAWMQGNAPTSQQDTPVSLPGPGKAWRTSTDPVPPGAGDYALSRGLGVRIGQQGVIEAMFLPTQAASDPYWRIRLYVDAAKGEWTVNSVRYTYRVLVYGVLEPIGGDPGGDPRIVVALNRDAGDPLPVAEVTQAGTVGYGALSWNVTEMTGNAFTLSRDNPKLSTYGYMYARVNASMPEPYGMVVNGYKVYAAYQSELPDNLVVETPVLVL